MTNCPRCRSSLIRTETDRWGKYVLCLECGWTDNGVGE